MRPGQRLASEGRIYAFEPTDTIELLRRNLAHHSARNVEPIKIALGSFSGRYTENVFRIWGQAAKRKEYDFETIDNIVTTLHVYRLDCLKIDVDSFDFEVLRGGTRDELAKRNQTVNEALEWLNNRGYDSAFLTDYENFILHRDTTAGAGPYSQSFQLTFDSRPLFLRLQRAKGKPVTGIFTPKCTIHNDATMEVQPENGSLRLTAPGPRWSYAASWAVSNEKELEGAFLIEIELRVSGGAIGIGCVTRDYSTLTGKGVFFEPADTLQTAAVVVEDISGTWLSEVPILSAAPRRLKSLPSTPSSQNMPHQNSSPLFLVYKRSACRFQSAM